MLPQPDCTFTIPSLHDDLELEGRLYFPRPPAESQGSFMKGFAVMAHPYAPLGGSFDDPVVQCVGSVLLKQGFVLNTFNFRGAGGSAGRTSWTGRAELGDYVSFYAFVLCLANGPGIADYIASSANTTGNKPKPALILGGYSFGSFIASHTPTLSTVRDIIIASSEGSPEYEIHARALELSRTLLGFLETQDRLGRSRLQVSNGTKTKRSSLGIVVGGYDSDSAHRRVSRESSRRSMDLDTVRRSIDRVRHKIGSRGGVPQDGAADHEAVNMATNTIAVLPSVAYLLVSPLLPPVSGFITFFTHLSYEPRGHASRPPPLNTESVLSKINSFAIFGNKDAFTSSKKLQKWSEELASAPGSTFSHREIIGAGHFWRESGVAARLREEISHWLDEIAAV